MNTNVCKAFLFGTLSILLAGNSQAADISPVTPVNNEADTAYIGNQTLGDVVVTGSRVPLTARQSAQVVRIITHDDIVNSAAQTVNDVLKMATGVDVRQRGAFGVQTDISINGGTFDQITLLLNGMPLSSPQTGHNAADLPVSPNEIDHIEVLEGASARVFGSSAFSGAINIITRPATATGVAANIEGGSFGSFGGGAQVSFSPKETFRNQLSGGYTQSDGGTDNSEFRKRRMFYQGNFASRYISVGWQGGITSQDYGANTFYSSRFPNQFEWTRRYMASANATITPFATSSDIARSFTITPAVYGHRDYDHYQLTKGMTGANAGENYHRMDVYGASLGMHIDWLLGKTAVGADVRKEHIISTAYGDELPESKWKDISGSDRKYSREGNRTNTSLYIEHDVIAGGLTVSAGLMANRNTGLDHDFRFYPGIDISYRPNDNWKIYVSWNKALRLPTFTDLYTSNAAQHGDINLKPEKNTTYKAGARYQNDVFNALATVFYSRGKNMIDWVYETEDASRYQAMNIGKLNNMGYSLEAGLNISEIIGLQYGNDYNSTKPIMLKLGYAYINQRHNTEHAIYRSLYALEYLRHKFVAELSHPIVSHLSASWALRWQQRMNGYHPYAKFDGRLQWTERHWQLYVKADNITCHRYYDLGSVLQPGLWIMSGVSVKF